MLVAKNFEKFQEDGRCYKRSVMTGHLASRRDKLLHGQFLREIADKICVKPQCYGRMTLPKNWKALFLQRRNRHYLLILSRLVSTSCLALPSVDFVVWLMKLLTI